MYREESSNCNEELLLIVAHQEQLLGESCWTARRGAPLRRVLIAVAVPVGVLIVRRFFGDLDAEEAPEGGHADADRGGAQRLRDHPGVRHPGASDGQGAPGNRHVDRFLFGARPLDGVNQLLSIRRRNGGELAALLFRQGEAILQKAIQIARGIGEDLLAFLCVRLIGFEKSIQILLRQHRLAGLSGRSDRRPNLLTEQGQAEGGSRAADQKFSSFHVAHLVSS